MLCESERSEVKVITDDCENINDIADITLFPNLIKGFYYKNPEKL